VWYLTISLKFIQWQDAQTVIVINFNTVWNCALFNYKIKQSEFMRHPVDM